MTEWMGIITMKISNLGYLLKEGIRDFFLHGFMSFAAICVTVACLLIVGTFSILMYNVNIIVEDLNQTNQILCFVDFSLSEAEAKSVGTRINQIPNVWQSTYIPREEALQNFVSGQDEDDAFAGLDASDLRHRFLVVLEDNTKMQETVDQIRKVQGVVKVTAEYELAEGFSIIQQVLRIASFGIIAVLLVVSLLIISNTVRLAMYDRRDEIAIMKMVGATNGFIRFPFVVEGFFLGIIGAGVAFGLEWGLYDVFVKKIAEVGALKLFTFVPFTALLQPMVMTFAATGLIVGIAGSLISIRRFLDV